MKIILSNIPKCWFLDLDGTLVPHNGHQLGRDMLFDSSVAFLKGLSPEDVIVLTTSRSLADSQPIIDEVHQVFHGRIETICDLPHGERIVINDTKPSGLVMAHALAVTRNSGLSEYDVIIDSSL